MIRARSLRSDASKTVACSRGDGGTGLLWPSWDSGLLEDSLAPTAFYHYALLVLRLPLYFSCVYVYIYGYIYIYVYIYVYVYVIIVSVLVGWRL